MSPGPARSCPGFFVSSGEGPSAGEDATGLMVMASIRQDGVPGALRPRTGEGEINPDAGSPFRGFRDSPESTQSAHPQDGRQLLSALAELGATCGPGEIQ